ncbi:MAG TPA: hypothetical protein VF337_02775 [Candidatus Limnocylindrales bacterium]
MKATGLGVMPVSMRLFAGPAATEDAPSPTPQELNWPIAADPLGAGQPSNGPGVRCIVIDGADLAAFTVAAAAANANTVWTATSGRYSVSVRPLYPDESGCPIATS